MDQVDCCHFVHEEFTDFFPPLLSFSNGLIGEIR